MLAILFWLVIFILGADYVFSEGLGLIPDLVIGNISRLLGWCCVWAIAAFVIWCFAED